MISRRSLVLAPLALAAAAARKPNLVLMVADQWAAGADAPNLEKLEQQGVSFSRAYSCYPSSAPARAALLTGRFPHAIDAARDVAIEVVLRDAGYRINELAGGESPFFLNATVTGDNAIGRLMATLDRLRLAEDTILAFVACRGEREDLPFEDSVRVPLAIRFPGVLPAGTTSDLLVSQVDVMPTLLALCGESGPEGIQGSDLSAMLQGRAGERPESIFAEGRIGEKDEWRMLVLGFDKIVINSKFEVTNLYNLADDPQELTNLARNPGLQLKRDALTAALRAFRGKLGDFKKRP